MTVYVHRLFAVNSVVHLAISVVATEGGGGGGLRVGVQVSCGRWVGSSSRVGL